MNFELIAPHYHWMERIFAGRLMQHARTTFLEQARNCRRALLVGEGPGRFLAELLRHNPGVRIVCVEYSAGMIRQARRRLARERLDLARVEFKQMDALDWTPPAEKFDLIATHFFLDCFPAGRLQQLVPLLAAGAAPDAVWLLTDFRLPEHGWRRARAAFLLASLYAFFRAATALAADRLTPPDPFLEKAGFRLADRRLMNFGFAHADFWRRIPA